MAELNPVWNNGGCVTAQDLRLMPDDLICTEGVAKLSDGALLVSTGLSGLSVQVAPGGAFIAGTQVAEQGMYHVFNDAAQAVTLSAAHPTLPRIDIIAAQVLDSQYSGVTDAFVLGSVTGTATSGADLTNLNGLGTLEDNSIALAYVLVPAAATLPGALTFSDERTDYRLCADNAPSGVSWLATEIFTADGTWHPEAYANGFMAHIITYGGGGAGGGSVASGGATSSYGTGGGGGGRSEKWLLFTDIVETTGVAVDIGAGGVSASGVDGGDGAATSVGATPYCKANGGSGGFASTASGTLGVGVGGPGAVVTGAVGDIKTRGTSGGMGIRVTTNTVLAGMGGPSTISGGASASIANGPGNNANANSGSGGGGGVSEGGEGAHFGGTGGSGIAIIEIFG